MRWIAAGLALWAALPAWAQDRRKEKPAQGYPGVDSKRVDEAIRKGIDFLRTAPSPSSHKNIANSDELILLAWVLGGGSQAEARFRELFDRMLQGPLTHTYKVALQAMILEEIDRVRYQDRIAHCAQALVDSQLKHGQWNYECAGDVKPDLSVATPAAAPKSASGARGAAKGVPPALRGTPAEGARAKPAVVRHIPIQRTKFGASDRGDDSNSQYAALGLRACHDAGILIPREVVELARTWWENSQQPRPNGNERPAVATGNKIAGVARGWDYSKGGTAQEKPFGSMTAGAVSAVVIYDAMLKKDWRQDPVVLDGLVWLDENFSVTTNPVKYPEWHYYYLYALERVGMLYNTWMIGSHDWYREGANYLLDAQKADGSWRAGSAFRAAGEGQATWDTCFAILFLKRATRTLDVASLDPNRR
jgi:hypothetical protein